MGNTRFIGDLASHSDLGYVVTMRHGLSFDIECYYQYNWRDFLGVSRTPTQEAERNTHRILDTLGERGQKATFFVLGNIARTFPSIVRRMVSEGHEVGIHGDEHRYVDSMKAEDFRSELLRGLTALYRAGATRIEGHRAPRFSLGPKTPFAADVLAELGFTYDSSIFPTRGAHGYGDPTAPLEIHRMSNGLFEVPMTAVPIGSRRVPAAGGGYVRYFPFAYTRWALQKRERMGLPAIFYFHPYEFELTKPKVRMRDIVTNPKGSVRLMRFNAMQSVGRGRSMRSKLESLLERYQFAPIRELVQEAKGA